jgi:DNA-binding CsgD family transcriptional regulator
MKRLGHSQLKTTMGCITELYRLRDLSSFTVDTLVLLNGAIPSEAAFNQFTRGALVHSVRLQPIPALAYQYLRGLGSRLFQASPLLARIRKIGKPTPVRQSDHISLTNWRRSTIYAECFRMAAFNYQMGVLFPAGFQQFGLLMNRKSRDFSCAEQLMLALLQPHVAQALINAQDYARLWNGIGAIEDAVLLVSSRGRIKDGTPTALAWLADYFGGTNGRAGLPGPLITWLKRMLSAPPLVPFVQTRNNDRLTIRAMPPLGETITLVLEEKRAGSSSDLISLGLTPREAEVLFWLSEAKSNWEIGTILGATTATIRKHVERILTKLKVENRTAAAAIAFDHFARRAKGGHVVRARQIQLLCDDGRDAQNTSKYSERRSVCAAAVGERARR